MIYYWWEPYLIQIFQSLASTSQQSEENMPSSTTQDTQKSSEDDESVAVVKSKNPYSIDAILRTPTSTPANTGVSPNTSNNAPIKRKLVEKEEVDNKNKNNELTIPPSDLKTEKKIKREETSEEELKVVEDEENDD